MATDLKTSQVLVQRLQAALSDLFGHRLSQGGLMNLLRRTQGRFARGQVRAVLSPDRAGVVASDETEVRIEGSNATHWTFRSPEAVVYHTSPTRAASVVREVMDGHRRAVWLSDHYPRGRVMGPPTRYGWTIRRGGSPMRWGERGSDALTPATLAQQGRFPGRSGHQAYRLYALSQASAA